MVSAELEEAVVFHLAEILGAEQLLRADDLRRLLGGLLDEANLVFEVGVGVGAAGHLREADVDDLGGLRGFLFHCVIKTNFLLRCSLQTGVGGKSNASEYEREGFKGARRMNFRLACSLQRTGLQVNL